MSTRIVKSLTPVYLLQVTQQPGNMQPNLEKIEGYYSGATQAWLQFHDSLGAPVNTTVPLYEISLGVIAPNGYFWQYANDMLRVYNGGVSAAGPFLTSGLILCLSSTSGTLTLMTGTNKSTFFVSVEETDNPSLDGATIVGDRTTAVKNRVIWADGASHNLQAINISSANVAATYLQLFTTGAPTALQVPQYQWQVPASAALFDLNFGDGLIPDTQDNSTTPATIHNGCYLAGSSTSGTFTALAANDFTLQAYYK